MIVVDTNTLVNYLWRQDDAVRVRRRDSQWAAPLTATSELRNALLGFVRQGLATVGEAKRMNAEALSLLGGRVHPVDGAAVLDVALECGLTAYDAEFVVCARTLGAPLVTLDGAVLRGAPDAAVSPSAFA